MSHSDKSPLQKSGGSGNPDTGTCDDLEPQKSRSHYYDCQLHDISELFLGVVDVTKSEIGL